MKYKLFFHPIETKNILDILESRVIGINLLDEIDYDADFFQIYLNLDTFKIPN